MRAITLSTQKGGMSRLRDKGGASPETLYLLKNGYVTTAKTIRARPGRTSLTAVDSASVGLTAYSGQLYTFSSAALPGLPALTNIVLPHPTNSALTIIRIHYAQPFLGRLYVVAEFSDNSIHHYWVDNPPARKPLNIYGYLERVQPTVPNGYYYEASNVSTATRWTSGETIVVNDLRQPTTYNKYNYKAISVVGTAPVKTSETEPTWPTQHGATVVEYSYGAAPPVTTPPPPVIQYPTDIIDEYGPFPPNAREP